MSCCRMGPNGGCCGEDWCVPAKEEAGVSNPNPVHSRCGLEDCDCEYTIEKLTRALVTVRGQCTAGLHPGVDKDEVFRAIAYTSRTATEWVEQGR
jgi:hypothetical protein